MSCVLERLDPGECESHIWDDVEYYKTLTKIPGKSQDTDECEFQVQEMQEFQVQVMSSECLIA